MGADLVLGWPFAAFAGAVVGGLVVVYGVYAFKSLLGRP